MNLQRTILITNLSSRYTLEAIENEEDRHEIVVYWQNQRKAKKGSRDDENNQKIKKKRARI